MARHRLALAFLLLAGCGHASPTGPTAVVPAEHQGLPWYGASVVGYRAVDLLALLDRAGPTVAARWPGWQPTGWVIESVSGPIPAPGTFYCGEVLCRDADPRTAPEVTTLRGAFYVDVAHGVKTIRVSWVQGPDDVVAMLTRELCNAAHWDRTHVLTDAGCRP